MGSVSRYWRLVRLDTTGQCRVEEVAIAKTFFQQHFPELVNQSDISDTAVQRALLHLVRERQPSATSAANSTSPNCAELCLRCFISHCIEQTCVQLETKFGTQHGFSRYDLLLFVLDDEIASKTRPPYRSFASEILQTFDPDRAGLSTWVARQVRHHRDLRRFLHERGIYLATDWGILNDTSVGQLRQVLTEFYGLAPAEIEPACTLLQAYHQVYRGDRLQQRQQGLLKAKETCSQPTADQLTRIAQVIQGQLTAPPSEWVLKKLQTLAARVRQYRLYILGAPLPSQSLDQPGILAKAIATPAHETDIDLESEKEFLMFYRKEIVSCLDQAIAKVTGDRITYLQRKNAQMVQPFLIALQLFHCQGKSMGEIAPQVGLQAQFQVTRLMKLKEFRASVRAQLLKSLLDSVLDKAKTYTDPTHLQTLNQQIEDSLDEHISTFMQQAEAEAAIAKHHPLTSLFARRLCHYLDAGIPSS